MRALDISYNNLSCNLYCPLLEGLTENEDLEEINLSHNHLLPLPTQRVREDKELGIHAEGAGGDRGEAMEERVGSLLRALLEQN